MTPFTWALKNVPKFMHPDFSLIETWSDVRYQINLEMDLAEAGELRWTPKQRDRAKRFSARLDATIAAQKEAR